MDIGFVDFGMAFDSITTLDTEDEPLTILGIESCPFNVAKSLVMLEMMKDKAVGARSVVEVWLSSLWSEETFLAFMKAVNKLRGKTGDNFTHQVKSILKFWAKASRMNKESALQFQMKGLMKSSDSTAMMNCCSLENEEDRVDYIRYFITKALYEDDSTILGSVVMCNVKEPIGAKQIFESCVEAAPYSIHTIVFTVHTWGIIHGTNEDVL